MSASLHLTTPKSIDADEWRQLLARDPRSTALQDPGFVSVFEAADPRARVLWWEIRDSEGRLVAALSAIERSRFGFATLVAGIAGTYGGPVCDPRVPDAEKMLAVAFARAGGIRCLRRELVWVGHEAPTGNWPGLRPLPTAVLDVAPELPVEDFLHRAFPKTRRTEGRRSDRRGMTVAVETDAAAVDDFYPIYVAKSEEWGMPPVAREVLVALIEEVDAAHFFVARDVEGVVAGAHLCLALREELFAWMGTTERRPGLYPSTLLIREEARWCHARGMRRLNLGSSIGEEGIANFKKLLGARSDPRWIAVVEKRPWRRSEAR